ncbi:1-deoxy-D-xylulose 5-phosphate reductoisomerase (Dxr) (PDB:1JVS) [Commensalibacter communis]|nr:1-deoxy-D-xylulose-5-phosphate reductoisomerase [Commensalibacter communis]CAI3923592.1 1-deoxy-D-xylulose 5-phosphate reductoisomerase (Dxr) (PDB:1JVS) [Commensalibacter communis]CAI3924123.1 1-deoxy-D-xylulose 5-phosphate reductoisomerase (Dxr) (PDB:1JVS) [Commensalibacter communis]CAI3946530.1 1-deoxy-D-xylulose 5-phosphate reductoisomerase (Dxr) (PDB:1JVS) [Commensalibacter communis]
MKTVSILGCTGSIGCSTVDLLLQDPDSFQTIALVGGKNVKKLAAQAIALNAQYAVIADEHYLPELKELLSGHSTKVSGGRQAVLEAASIPVDWTMAAITGAIGLEPTMAAVKNGKYVALANKEALVSAGDVMLKAVQEAGATLLPVDSEHNAIFQSMADKQIQSIEKIILTASGGPFRNTSLEDMKKVTLKQALKHPTWTMGAKITIDSASMFNKGLEIIEAARLFDMAEHKIDVLIHPQSIIHSMVQYEDGSMIAQLGAPDMRIPIAHTLAWPYRMRSNVERLNLTQVAKLEFEAPDEVRFPALRLSREALREGKCAPTILSAANEVAVDAFLKEQIGFLDIPESVEAVMQKLGAPQANTIQEVIHWDQEARKHAEAWIKNRNRM